ncbi:coiled-coil domain-containing protein R3HCC1L-like [Watersipora subatra]|uniref:coiled-coil domain-containing protein R3HCC1L-like n=1 Tax=Watersipora subatra TaxID=2589382 RepID=UPI00355BB49F
MERAKKRPDQQRYIPTARRHVINSPSSGEEAQADIHSNPSNPTHEKIQRPPPGRSTGRGRARPMPQVYVPPARRKAEQQAMKHSKIGDVKGHIACADQSYENLNLRMEDSKLDSRCGVMVAPIAATNCVESAHRDALGVVVDENRCSSETIVNDKQLFSHNGSTAESDKKFVSGEGLTSSDQPSVERDGPSAVCGEQSVVSDEQLVVGDDQLIVGDEQSVVSGKESTSVCEWKTKNGEPSAVKDGHTVVNDGQSTVISGQSSVNDEQLALGEEQPVSIHEQSIKSEQSVVSNEQSSVSGKPSVPDESDNVCKSHAPVTSLELVCHPPQGSDTDSSSYAVGQPEGGGDSFVLTGADTINKATASTIVERLDYPPEDNCTSENVLKPEKYATVVTDQLMSGGDNAAAAGTEFRSVPQDGNAQSDSFKAEKEGGDLMHQTAADESSVAVTSDSSLEKSSKSSLEPAVEPKLSKKQLKAAMKAAKKSAKAGKKSKASVVAKSEAVNDKCASESSTSSKAKAPVAGHSPDDDDSWDTKFDEDGECLDEELLKELNEKVGDVTICKPVIDYLEFTPKDIEVDDEQFGHLVEIYDFSSTLDTSDLVNIFTSSVTKDFDIKWVDDTHAIGVFSSCMAAQDALAYIHPMVKTRPLSQASRATKLKAKTVKEFLLPKKARPETNAFPARRMVANILGVSSNVTKEQRAKERQQLKTAKEKKREDNNTRQSVWEGTVAAEQTSDEANLPTLSRPERSDRKWSGSFGKCAMDSL